MFNNNVPDPAPAAPRAANAVAFRGPPAAKPVQPQPQPVQEPRYQELHDQQRSQQEKARVHRQMATRVLHRPISSIAAAVCLVLICYWQLPNLPPEEYARAICGPTPCSTSTPGYPVGASAHAMPETQPKPTSAAESLFEWITNSMYGNAIVGTMMLTYALMQFAKYFIAKDCGMPQAFVEQEWESAKVHLLYAVIGTYLLVSLIFNRFKLGISLTYGVVDGCYALALTLIFATKQYFQHFSLSKWLQVCEPRDGHHESSDEYMSRVAIRALRPSAFQYNATLLIIGATLYSVISVFFEASATGPQRASFVTFSVGCIVFTACASHFTREFHFAEALQLCTGKANHKHRILLILCIMAHGLFLLMQNWADLSPWPHFSLILLQLSVSCLLFATNKRDDVDANEILSL